MQNLELLGWGKIFVEIVIFEIAKIETSSLTGNPIVKHFWLKNVHFLPNFEVF